MTTASRIESSDLNLTDLLKDFYSVPDFQREYVWQEQNARKLLEDVQTEFYDERNELVPDLEYFIGSIVVYPDEQGTFRLIDGQQRLTTIYLVLCAIRDRLKELNEKPQQALLKQIADTASHPVTGDDVFRYRVTLQYSDSDHVLETIAEGNTPIENIELTTTSVENIITAYKAIREFLTVTFKEDGTKVKAFYAAFTNRVKLIRIKTPEITHALKIFETINDRGVGLNAMDLLKNLLFMRTAVEDQATLKAIWKGLVETLEGCKEKPLRFLRYYILAFYEEGSKPLREDGIYEYFSKSTNAQKLGILNDPVGFAQRLLDRARDYARFAANKDPKGNDNRYLSNIAYLSGQARQHFILLLASQHLTPTLFSDLCHHIENLYFCYIITGVPAKNFETPFPRWAKDLRTLHSKEELDEFVARYILPELETRLDRFDFAMRQLSLKSIQQYRMRYILAKLTQFIDERAWDPSNGLENLKNYMGKGVDIEHILPAAPSPSQRAAFDKASEYNDYVTRLGNLMLLESTINRSVSNGTYEEKRPGYRQSKFLLTRALVEQPKVGSHTKLNNAVKDLEQFDTWTSETIEQRQEMLLRLAQRIWLESSGVQIPSRLGT